MVLKVRWINNLFYLELRRAMAIKLIPWRAKLSLFANGKAKVGRKIFWRLKWCLVRCCALMFAIKIYGRDVIPRVSFYSFKLRTKIFHAVFYVNNRKKLFQLIPSWFFNMMKYFWNTFLLSIKLNHSYAMSQLLTFIQDPSISKEKRVEQENYRKEMSAKTLPFDWLLMYLIAKCVFGKPTTLLYLFQVL